MKTKIIFASIVTAVLLLAIIGIILIVSAPEKLGNINASYSEAATLTSDISFSVQGGSTIKYSFRSDIESGELIISLYDSSNTKIHELDDAKELEAFLTLKDSDTYTLKADCKNFIGEYSITIYNAD